MSPDSVTSDGYPVEDPPDRPLSWGEIGKLFPIGYVPPPRVGDRFGPYELVELIGSGGMGTVFKAAQAGFSRKVAIKFPRDDGLDAESAIRRFLEEAESQMGVEHPNVVPVLYVNNIYSPYFFTMPLFKRSLASSLADGLLSSDPRARVELMLKVARAVHHAHQRGWIHCDLKPGNILLGERDEPHVADFGLARPLGEAGDGAAGTPDYMAPEQANGSRDLTVAVDVYSIGVILFELLTGQLPPFSDSAVAMDEQVVGTAASARLLLQKFDPDVQAIVMKCLEIEPERRYAGAAALADDLERWLKPEPVKARPLGRWERAGYWWRRHPARAAAMVSTLCFLTVLAASYLRNVEELERELRSEILGNNTWGARAQARAVEPTLSRLMALVEQAARTEAIVQRVSLREGDPRTATPRANWLPPGYDQHFDSFLLLDARGKIVDRFPSAPAWVGTDLEFRRYFSCARDSAAPRCVSGAYLSKIDDAFRFAVSGPIRSPTGEFLGVAAGTLQADSVLNSILIPELSAPTGGRVVALAAIRDPERQPTEQATEWLLLQHPALLPGKSKHVNSSALDKLSTGFQGPVTDDHYRDPVLGGDWLAAFAPVAGTRWTVIVQTPAQDAIDPRLLKQAGLSAAIAAAAGLALGLASYLVARLRSWLGRRSLSTQRCPPPTGFGRRAGRV